MLSLMPVEPQPPGKVNEKGIIAESRILSKETRDKVDLPL
jgi:hypothetical protein